MGIPYAEVIGDPVAHSKSPLIHKYWLERLGMDGDYRATRVTADELPAFLATRRADPDWRGCNVTMPHKEAVLPLLDHVENSGLAAVNCIAPLAGGLRGFNTDGAGVYKATLHWEIAAEDSRICLIGGGGAARSAIAELDAYCYFTFDLITRDERKGRAFLESCNVQGEAYSFDKGAEALAGRDAVINASPLGMTGFPPMPETVLKGLATAGRRRLFRRRRRGYAIEMVTTPARTAFMDHAEAAGLTVSDGLTMLVGQARVAFEAFFGVPPPACDSALRERLTS